MSRSVRRERSVWGTPFSTTVLDKLEPARSKRGACKENTARTKAEPEVSARACPALLNPQPPTPNRHSREGGNPYTQSHRPHPPPQRLWTPAFAGVTKERGARHIARTVIPAKAGIHFVRRHRRKRHRPASMNPGLRRDDEKSSGPVPHNSRTATGTSAARVSRFFNGSVNGAAAISNTSPSSVRTPSENDNVAVPKKWTWISPGRRNSAYLK